MALNVATHTNIGGKKNRRKRGLSELDLGCGDCPALKRHRSNSQQTIWRENKENKENKESIESIDSKYGKVSICDFGSFKSEETEKEKIGLLKGMDSKYDKESEKSGKKVNLMNMMDMDDKKVLTGDENILESEEEDIDIDMITPQMPQNNSKSNRNDSDKVFQEAWKKSMARMDCDSGVSVLGNKAKNTYDYTTKRHGSGLLFLVQCGVGVESTR